MSAGFDNRIGPSAFGGSSRHQRLLGLVLAATVLAALQTATQQCAELFNYQAALGPHYERLYPPWAFVGWFIRWQSSYPAAFHEAANAGFFVLAGGMLIAVAIKARLSRPSRYLHGSARWANKTDIRKVGLLPRRRTLWQWIRRDKPAAGVCVGLWCERGGRKHYLWDRSDAHVLGMAPTRSGKGVGFVLPTLLSWPASAFVLDLKGELYELTAGWRSSCADNRVFRFEPAAAGRTVRWNPLAEVRLGTAHEVGDVQSIALMLIDSDGKGLEGDHWRLTSFSLGVGVILHVLYRAQIEGTPATLAEVDAILSNPDCPAAELWHEMTVYPHVGGEPHPVIRKSAQDQLAREEREATSVLSTLKTALSLYRDPVVARNTNTSDFQIRDLMHNDRPVTVYLVTSPADKDRLRPLVRLLVSLQLRILADGLDFVGGRPKPRYKHRLLMLLDEFASLKKVDVLQESLAFVAGYGIKFYLLVQDRNQLTSRQGGYGPEETITANCHVQFYMPPDNPETAAYISRLVGDTTVQHEQVTSSRGSSLFGSRSRTVQLVKRPLMTPDEVRTMPKAERDAQQRIVRAGSMLAIAAGCPAILSREQPLYWQDAVFRARAAIAAPKEGRA